VCTIAAHEPNRSLEDLFRKVTQVAQLVVERPRQIAIDR
jgi:hypothetical protein